MQFFVHVIQVTHVAYIAALYWTSQECVHSNLYAISLFQVACVGLVSCVAINIMEVLQDCCLSTTKCLGHAGPDEEEEEERSASVDERWALQAAIAQSRVSAARTQRQRSRGVHRETPARERGLDMMQISRLPTTRYRTDDSKHHQQQQQQQNAASSVLDVSLPGCPSSSANPASSPTTRTRNDNGDADNKKCAICLESFCDNDELRTLPCIHMYHVACIDGWLPTNGICPVCRVSASV